MITASIVTYNNNVLDLEAVLRSLLISPVQKVWIIDHSDVFTRLEGELNEYMRNDEEFRKHIGCGFVLKYVRHRNNGYGGGHNVAIREAISEGSEYHLVINPDVWFGPEVVPAIWKAMENDHSIAQIMPKVLYLNGEVQYVAKLLPSPLDLIGRFFFPHFLIRRRNDRHELKHSGYDKVMNPPVSREEFLDLKDSIVMSPAVAKMDLFDNIGQISNIIKDFYHSDAFTPLFSDSTKWERLLETKYKSYEKLITMKPTLDYVMPGKVIDAGNGIVEGDVVHYKFSGERLIPHPYDVTITSRVSNIWAFVVTALVVLLAIGCLFYRRIRKLIF